MRGIFVAVKDKDIKHPKKYEISYFGNNQDRTWKMLEDKVKADFGAMVLRKNKHTDTVWNVIEIDFPSHLSGEMGSLKWQADNNDSVMVLKKDELNERFTTLTDKER